MPNLITLETALSAFFLQLSPMITPLLIAIM
jgi:hypothetical protein